MLFRIHLYYFSSCIYRPYLHRPMTVLSVQLHILTSVVNRVHTSTVYCLVVSGNRGMKL